ncbi:MAG: hypothetical protein ABI783_08345, partial [Actinomycetota bacterium]
MTEADVQRLLASEKIRRVAPDPEMARAELDVARRHIASAEKIMADDPTLAFTALYDAMRKAIAAHMRSRGYRVTRGPGAYAKTGGYARAALDHLDIGSHLDEFDACATSGTRASTRRSTWTSRKCVRRSSTSRRSSKRSRTTTDGRAVDNARGAPSGAQQVAGSVR